MVELAQDSPVDFLDGLVEGDLYPLRAQPGLRLDWFKVYQRWCSHVGVKPASMKRFVDLLKRKRGMRTAKKG